MRRGDPRLPPSEQIKHFGLEDWARRLVLRLYDRFREIDADVVKLETFDAALPASVTLTAGTSTSTVSDLTTMLDGNVYHIDEVAAAPGYDLECTFAGVEQIQWLVARLWYNGLATHGCRVQLYNYRTAAWNTLVTFPTGVDYSMIEVPIVSSLDYISSRAARVRFYHTETGNTSHDLDIDYVALLS